MAAVMATRNFALTPNRYMNPAPPENYWIPAKVPYWMMVRHSRTGP